MKLEFAYLHKADEKFKKYCANGMIDLNDPLHVAFKTALDDKCNELISKMLADEGPERAAGIVQYFEKVIPIKVETKDFKPTGRLFIKPTANLEHPPAVFTPVNGKAAETTRPIFGGSVGQLKFLLNPYVNSAKKSYGVSLLLESACIFEFASGGGGGGKASGFDIGPETQDSTTGAPPGTAEDLPF